MDPGPLVRMEVLKGWSQVQKLHNRLKTIPVAPAGGVSFPGGSQAALVDETIRIIGTFTNVITYLNQPVSCGALGSNSKECSSPSHNPLSSFPISALEDTDITTSGVIVEIAPGATVADGACLGSQSKATTPVTGSECSQSDEDPFPRSKKRKQTAKCTPTKQAEQQQQLNEIIPDDGHSWRKYGQKDILGSRHPKSYYRCTHKRDSGCPAIKYVQRSDTDPSSFHITYRGEHNCHGLRFQQTFSPQQALPQQIPLNSACLRINSDGGLQITPSGPTLTPSPNLLVDTCPSSDQSIEISCGFISTTSNAQQQPPEFAQCEDQPGESEVVAESLFDIGFVLTASPDQIDCFDISFPFEQPAVSEPFCITAD